MALKSLLKASILNSSESGIPSLVNFTLLITSFLKTHIPLCESLILMPWNKLVPNVNPQLPIWCVIDIASLSILSNLLHVTKSRLLLIKNAST